LLGHFGPPSSGKFNKSQKRAIILSVGNQTKLGNKASQTPSFSIRRYTII
jgi:hypothetical protein